MDDKHNYQTETLRIAAWNALLEGDHPLYGVFCDWFEISKSLNVEHVAGGESVLKLAEDRTKDL